MQKPLMDWSGVRNLWLLELCMLCISSKLQKHIFHLKNANIWILHNSQSNKKSMHTTKRPGFWLQLSMISHQSHQSIFPIRRQKRNHSSCWSIFLYFISRHFQYLWKHPPKFHNRIKNNPFYIRILKLSVATIVITLFGLTYTQFSTKGHHSTFSRN